MSALDPAPSTRLACELTADEAGIAASRAALRRALAGGLTSRHLAPLAVFVLAIGCTAILASTSLISRRHGEVALLLATAAFMIHRLWSRRRFALARRESAASIDTIRAGGPFGPARACGPERGSGLRIRRLGSGRNHEGRSHGPDGMKLARFSCSG